MEFWATKDTENSRYSERTTRRKISALVLRNLPTELLMSGDDFINLGLLPPNWPNHGSEWANPTEQPLREFPANKNMTEREVYTDALLTLSFGQGETDEPMETDDERPDFYKSRMAILDAIFDTDTAVTLIPGFKEDKHKESMYEIHLGLHEITDSGQEN